MLHFTVYCTTCTINGKVYVGVHETENPDDDYLGSGKVLRRAIKKHGKDAFTKQILHDCATRKEMFLREAEIVTPEFVARKDNYNILPGGFGGWYVANQNLSFEDRSRNGKASREKQLLRAQTDPEFARAFQENGKRTLERLRKEGKVLTGGEIWKGRTHSEETKHKMRERALARDIRGAKHPQYGYRGVCHLTLGAKKIPANEFATHISQGWVPGRKI